MTLLEQFQQLAPLAANATAGPWECAPAPYQPTIHAWDQSARICRGVVTAEYPCPQDPALAYEAGSNNAAFIVAARNLLTPENVTLLTAALALAPGWIDVRERLPEPGTTVLAVLENVDGVVMARYKHPRPFDEPDEPQWQALGNHWYYCAYWMPLPSPPQPPTA